MNRFMNGRSSQHGWMLLEVVIGTFILMMILSYITPILMQSKRHADVIQHRLQGLSWSEGFKDNLKAQWQTLVWNGCYGQTVSTIELGNSSSSNVPDRIKNKSLEKSSDWLKGKASDQCGTTQTVQGEEVEFYSSCKWKVNQSVVFSQCLAESYGWISKVSGSNITAQFNSITPNAEGNWPSGLLFRTEPYVWYVSKGKNSHMALWRTPLDSGNSLELWSGLKKIAIYPMLDSDLDGVLDELSTEYGEYPVAQLRAFWVEALVTHENCQDSQSLMHDYKNFRGETWHYNSRCDSIIDFIIPLSAF